MFASADDSKEQNTPRSRTERTPTRPLDEDDARSSNTAPAAFSKNTFEPGLINWRTNTELTTLTMPSATTSRISKRIVSS